MSEYEEKVDNFLNEINNKFSKKVFLNKFNTQKTKLEDIVECPIKIEFNFAEKFGKEFSEYEDTVKEGGEMMQDENYWNYHNTLIRELNEFGLNMETKTFYFFGDVEENSISWVASKIDSLQYLSPHEDKPITLQISSFGGDSYAMFGIIDLIRLSEVPINTKCFGQVMSAGACILASGKHRMMSKNSIMMLHDVSSGNFGSYKNLKNHMNHINFVQELFYKFLEEVSNKDAAWWEEKLQRDLYLSAENALELGLIDEII